MSSSPCLSFWDLWPPGVCSFHDKHQKVQEGWVATQTLFELTSAPILMVKENHMAKPKSHRAQNHTMPLLAGVTQHPPRKGVGQRLETKVCFLPSPTYLLQLYLLVHEWLCGITECWERSGVLDSNPSLQVISSTTSILLLLHIRWLSGWVPKISPSSGHHEPSVLREFHLPPA